jgi:hypothetical protein
MPCRLNVVDGDRLVGVVSIAEVPALASRTIVIVFRKADGTTWGAA